MKKGHCEKCKKYTYVAEHHILPKCEFGDGETVDLCSNCHTDYHQKLGFKNLKGNSMEFHYEKFLRWLTGLSIVLALIFIIL